MEVNCVNIYTCTCACACIVSWGEVGTQSKSESARPQALHGIRACTCKTRYRPDKVNGPD